MTFQWPWSRRRTALMALAEREPIPTAVSMETIVDPLPTDVDAMLDDGMIVAIADLVPPPPRPEPGIVERYSSMYADCLNILRIREAKLVTEIEEEHTRHESVIATKTDELNQVRLAAAATEASISVMAPPPEHAAGEPINLLRKRRTAAEKRPVPNSVVVSHREPSRSPMAAEQLPDGAHSG